jgi:hypothetical protein
LDGGSALHKASTYTELLRHRKNGDIHSHLEWDSYPVFKKKKIFRPLDLASTVVVL